MTITTDNYEYYFYQYAEGQLTEAERIEVEAFLQQHPDLADELSLYDPGLKLEPATVAFPDKESLLRHKPVLMPIWRWAAVACVAALLLVGVWQFTERTPQQPVVAEMSPMESPTKVVTELCPQRSAEEINTSKSPVLKSVPPTNIKAKAVAESAPAVAQHETLSEEPLLAETKPTEPQRAIATETTVIIYTDILLVPEEPVAVAEVDTTYSPFYVEELLTQGRSLYDRLRARMLRAQGDTRAMLASL